MENMEQVDEQTETIADQLDVLQKDADEGREVDCVRTLVTYLRAGDIDSAKAVCFNESDKIVSHPEIKKFIQENLFTNGEENPWSMLDKLKK